MKWSLITKFTISQPEEKKNQQTPRTALTPPTHRTYKSLLKEFFFFSSFILNEEISGKNMKEKKRKGKKHCANRHTSPPIQPGAWPLHSGCATGHSTSLLALDLKTNHISEQWISASLSPYPPLHPLVLAVIHFSPHLSKPFSVCLYLSLGGTSFSVFFLCLILSHFLPPPCSFSCSRSHGSGF